MRGKRVTIATPSTRSARHHHKIPEVLVNEPQTDDLKGNLLNVLKGVIFLSMPKQDGLITPFVPAYNNVQRHDSAGLHTTDPTSLHTYRGPITKLWLKQLYRKQALCCFRILFGQLRWKVPDVSCTDANFSTHIEAYFESNTIFKSNNVFQCCCIAVMMQHFGFGKQDSMCFFPTYISSSLLAQSKTYTWIHTGYLSALDWHFNREFWNLASGFLWKTVMEKAVVLGAFDGRVWLDTVRRAKRVPLGTTFILPADWMTFQYGRKGQGEGTRNRAKPRLQGRITSHRVYLTDSIFLYVRCHCFVLNSYLIFQYDMIIRTFVAYLHKEKQIS